MATESQKQPVIIHYVKFLFIFALDRVTGNEVAFTHAQIEKETMQSK